MEYICCKVVNIQKDKKPYDMMKLEMKSYCLCIKPKGAIFMGITLIALDLDRTTLNNESKLSEGNKKALEAAIEKGIYVVIATGRSFTALPKDVLSIKGIEYAITSNGAQIRNLKDNTVIYENYIAEEALIDVWKFLKRNVSRHMMIETFVEGVPYVEEEEFYRIKDGGECLRSREYVLTTRNPMKDLLGHLYNHRTKVENINLFFGDMDTMTDVRKELDQLQNVTITSSLDNNWEIGGATTSKAQALQYLITKLGCKKEEVMACGDSLNDGAMLQLAGMAVAVGNARDEIKAMADFVALSNDKDGVAQAVAKFAL